MFRSGQIVIRSLVVACVSAALWGTAGCQSEDQTSAVKATASDSGKDRHADAMLNTDTERARAAMRENRHDSTADRPAVPTRREGSRVVDQPRVGP
ncbi:MAG: hypothetical protein JXQ75_03090 [Phycisphaerae bacterium]|nr:hypothetical protein [Phycisphaerae bacterium]